MAIERFNLVLEKVTEISPNTRHFEFVREDGAALGFIPGQFVTFFLEDKDGKAKRRSYSIANGPGATVLEFGIAYVENGLASGIFFNLKPGDTLSAMGPLGKLVIDHNDHKKRYLLMSTGTGVVPYRAMLSDLALRMHEEPEFEAHLVLGVRKREDLIYKDDFIGFSRDASNFHFHAQYSREDATDFAPYEHKGYVQESLARLKPNPDTDKVYLCGNPAMIDITYEKLKALGFSDENIQREKYHSSN